MGSSKRWCGRGRLAIAYAPLQAVLTLEEPSPQKAKDFDQGGNGQTGRKYAVQMFDRVVPQSWCRNGREPYAKPYAKA